MKLPDATQERATALRAAATWRWLAKDELVFLLQHYKAVGVPLLRALRLRPPSGTLLFYNTREVSDYKKDGWHWQKRTDKTGRVREDRAKLVINRDVIVLGTYVHSADTATFHRRIYTIRDSEESIVLVHYFDEANREAATSPRPSHPKHSKHKASTSVGANKGVKRSLPATNCSTSSTGFTPLYPTLKPTPSEDTVDSIMKNCFEMDFEPQATQFQESMPIPSDPEMDLLLKDSPMDGLSTDFDAGELLFHEFDPTAPTANGDPREAPQTFELAEISDFSPDWDFGEGGAKILLCLATKLPDELAQDPVKLFVQFGATRVRAEKVSETVLRCTAPSSRTLGSVELFVCHCHNALDSQTIQLSLKKKFTYRSHHQVSPSLLGNGASNRNAHEEVVIPEALDLPTASVVLGSSYGTGKRGRSPTVPSRTRGEKKPNDDTRRGSNKNLSSYVESDLDERQCKIRVVERLSEFQKAIWTKVTEPTFSSATSASDVSGLTPGPFSHEEGAATASSLSNFSLSAAESEVEDTIQSPNAPQPDRSADPATTLLSSNGSSISLDDCTIEALSDKDLEQLSEKLLERVVRQLITVAYTSEELLEELNSLDETGLSLLHYVSFYNYAQLVPVLLAHGAHINQQSTQGQTALHLAAGCGHQEVVDVLLESGVDLLARDFDGLTAADRAEKSGHADVATKLRRHMGRGETPATDSPVPDEIFGFGGSPMEIDNAPSPYVDAGDMGLLENSECSWPSREHSTSCGSTCEAVYACKATSYAGENQEHNRKLLLGAFSTMSLHDKCALSLSISRDSSVAHGARRRESSVGDESTTVWSPGSNGGNSSSSTSVGLGSSPASMVGLDASLVAGRLRLSGSGENDTLRDSDVKSVIAEDEASLTKLQAAMELMGPEERQSLEEEVKVLQHNIRAWLLKRNCKNMREATERLREATRSIADQQKQQEAAERRAMLASELSQRERAAVTLQAATRSILARRSFLQTRHVAIKVQAATRGVLCRKNFARMKAHALASLVIQRNVREWWHKQPAAGAHPSDSDVEEEEKPDVPLHQDPVDPVHGELRGLHAS